MIGAESLVNDCRRPVRDAERFQWKRHGIGGDLGKDGLEALSQHGGPNGDSDVPVPLKRHSNILAWAGAAALDETGNTDTVIASVDHSALKLGLLVPAKRLQAFVE